MSRHGVTVGIPEVNATIDIELDDALAPKTVKAILGELSIVVNINRWGDELYTDALPVKTGQENSMSVVKLMDVAYWPEGKGLCLFFGPTPISSGEEIKPYSPVNVIGRILSSENVARRVGEKTPAIIRKV